MHNTLQFTHFIFKNDQKRSEKKVEDQDIPNTFLFPPKADSKSFACRFGFNSYNYFETLRTWYNNVRWLQLTDWTGCSYVQYQYNGTINYYCINKRRLVGILHGIVLFSVEIMHILTDENVRYFIIDETVPKV